MKPYLHHTVNPHDRDLVATLDDLPLWSAPFGLKLLDVVVLKKRITALDVGCGAGFPLIEIAQRLGETGTVIGLDPWAQALRRVQTKIRVFGLRHVNTLQGRAENIPLMDRCIDLILSNNGINNVDNMEAALAECYRVSRPGSQFVLTMNLEQSMIEFYRILKGVLKKSGFHADIDRIDNHIRRKRKPVSFIRKHLKNSGFIIRNEYRDHFRLTFSDGSAMLNHSLIRFWFMPAWREAVAAEHLDAVFSRVEQDINAIAAKKGSFHLTIPFVTIDCRTPS